MKEKGDYYVKSDKKDIMKELNNISHLYNLNENGEGSREEAHGEQTLEQELDNISKLYNLN